MSLRIKICGITRPQDALAAAEAGADALGFMFFAGSSRAIDLAAAREIIRQLPPFIARVGVFVNPSREEVLRAMEAGIDTLQFHGEESPEFCASFDRPVIKALRVRDASSLTSLGQYRVAAILLDAFVPGQLGGTGARFDWELAIRARETGARIILAGGLTPENIGEAVRKVRPFGVDVSSGVECSPGQKDSAAIFRFIEKARAAAGSEPNRQ